MEQSDATEIPMNAVGLPLSFTGNAREYFPIWVANFLLCLLTLGLFTPWAKVRARKYFYSRTKLAGHTFSYRGDPWRILLGRVILAAGAIAFFLNSILQVVPLSRFWIFMLAAGIFAPFILWKSAIFNFSNTSYRGISLSLDVKLREVYWLAFGFLVQAVFTVGLAATTFGYQYRGFFINHLSLGQTRFSAKISGWTVFKRLFPMILLVGVTQTVISSVVVFFMSLTSPVLTALVWLNFIAFIGITDSITTGALCDQLLLGEIRFRSRIDKWELAWLYVKAAVLTFATLGFAWPWTRVAILKYKLEHLTVHAPDGAMDQFVQAKERRVRGTGGFATELFDFDLGI